MIKKLLLAPRHMAAMRRHVARRAPLEACGMLAGKNNQVETVLGIHNDARSPVRFRMAARAQWRAFQRIEAAGLELVGIYHSHPNGPEPPSPTDIDEAMYPVVQIIWSRQQGKWQARGFWIEAGHFSEATLQVINPE